MFSIDDFMQDIQTGKRDVIVSDFDNTIFSMDDDQYMHPQLVTHLNELLSDPNKRLVIISQKMNEAAIRQAIIEAQGQLPPAFENLTVIKEGEFINWWLQRMNEPSYDILAHLSRAGEEKVDELSLNSTDAFRAFKEKSSPAAVKYFEENNINTFQEARNFFEQKKDLWEKVQRIGRISIINFIDEMAKKGEGEVIAYIDDNFEDIFRALTAEPFPTYTPIYAGKSDGATPDYFEMLQFLIQDTEDAALLKAQLASLTYQATKMIAVMKREGLGLKTEYERIKRYQNDIRSLTAYISILEQRLNFEGKTFHAKAEIVKKAPTFTGRKTAESVIQQEEGNIKDFFSDTDAYLDCLLYTFKDHKPAMNNNNNNMDNIVEVDHLRASLLGGIDTYEESRLELELKAEPEFEYVGVHINPEQKNPFAEEEARRKAHEQRIDLYSQHHFNDLREPQKEKLLKPLEALLKEKQALEELCHNLKERGGNRKVTLHSKERKGIEGKLADFQQKLNACNVRIKKLQDLIPEAFEHLDKKQQGPGPH